MGSTTVAFPIQRVEAGKEIAGTCVQFGFCTSVCPTYVLDGQENDSPRGRIALIRTMLEQGGPPTPETVIHLDRCLSCLSCTTTCAAGVNYRELIDTARDYIEASGVRPWHERAWRAALARLLTSPRALSLGMRMGRPWLSLFASRPGRLGAMARLGRAPALRALARRESLTDLQSDILQADGTESVTIDSSTVPSGAGTGHAATAPYAPSALSTPPAAYAPTTTFQPTHAATATLRRVALLDGCAQSALGPEINDATRRLLTRLGVAIVAPPAARAGACCGALPLHMGRRDQARDMAAYWVDVWGDLLDRRAIDAIIITTSGCGSVIRHYAELFDAGDPRQARARRVADHTLDISECIARLALRPGDAHRGARVAYHDACSLKHGQKLTQPPRQVLRRLGFEVLEPGESHLCCGSAGTYNLLQPAIADRLGERKAANLDATRPDVIVAGNLGCLVQISRFTPVPIAHWVQLVDWATGGPAPVGLETFQPRAVEPEAASGLAAAPAGEPALADAADPTSPDAFW
ncbi:MAG: heterodisulfide reductase-related iron-sulfur binding cluster [Pigmentiphaga sp.]|nr:heterodisulfide reductase-related iron-sulfur binding cluster [Pigmentiphaga sp.]